MDSASKPVTLDEVLAVIDDCRNEIVIAAKELAAAMASPLPPALQVRLDTVAKGVPDLQQQMQACRESLLRLEGKPGVDLEPLHDDLDALRRAITAPTPSVRQKPLSWREVVAGLLLAFTCGIVVTLWWASTSGESATYIRSVVQATITELYNHPAKGGKK